MPGFRKLKPKLLEILRDGAWESRLPELDAMEPKPAIGALFGLLLHPEEDVRWRTVKAFGCVVPRLAEADMEDARTFMRQLMWRMNEESGNIGWGIGEVWGEVMAVQPRLAEEYHTILISYIREHEGICHGNFLDHPPLRWGVLWGLARLAEARPELMEKAVPHLLEIVNPEKAMEGREGTPEGLECHDAQARGLACLALGLIGDRAAAPALEGLAGDRGRVSLFWDGEVRERCVSELAAEALAKLR